MFDSSQTYQECSLCANAFICYRLLNEGEISNVSELFPQVDGECENYVYSDVI